MNEQAAITVTDVEKNFILPHEKYTGIKQAIINFRPNRKMEVQHALKGITFEIKKGEFFGIVGRNGSGKSTLLKLIAHIYTPNKGSVRVNGSLTPFIELGVGFNHELTGRENVYLNGALLGFDRRQMDDMYDEIVEFAELHKFMDQKLKNYSSGMQVRLAFSIAIRAKSDILLLDEVLAVGDAIFQEKCFNYFKELKRDKRTVVLVSHDSSSLLEFCDRGVLIEGGQVVSQGDINKVVNDYTEILNAKEEADSASEILEGKKDRWGTGAIEILSAEALNFETKKKQSVFADKDERFLVRVRYQAKSDQEAPVYGITIADAAGQRLFVSNTMWMEMKTDNIKNGETITVEWEVPNSFNSGDVFIGPAVASSNGYTSFDWRENFVRLKIRKTLISSGFINAPHRIKIEKES